MTIHRLIKSHYSVTIQLKIVVSRVAFIVDMSNILICGTPGTGKSTLAEKVGEETGWTVISVVDFAKEHGHVE